MGGALSIDGINRIQNFGFDTSCKSTISKIKMWTADHKKKDIREMTEMCMQNFCLKIKGREYMGNRCRWNSNIRMGLREICCGCVGWIHLAHG